MCSSSLSSSKASYVYRQNNFIRALSQTIQRRIKGNCLTGCIQWIHEYYCWAQPNALKLSHTGKHHLITYEHERQLIIISSQCYTNGTRMLFIIIIIQLYTKDCRKPHFYVSSSNTYRTTCVFRCVVSLLL